MRGRKGKRTSVRLGLLCRAAATGVLAAAPFGMPAFAQDISSLAEQSTPGAQMLLEADTLVYDNDAQTVTAVGGVRIQYDGNRLVAQRVVYDQKTARMKASGEVQLVDRDGNTVYSDNLDVTDDFADGFVNALRVETPDKTYFAAESAQREAGVMTVFNNGVYTACEPCRDQPDKPQTWRIKAKKIIWDGKAKTVRFERPKFEFLGLPIATLPYFEMADPTVKRKSGFLMPSISYKSELGVGVTVPYYLALSPTFDLTYKGTYYSKQGFLSEAEWRQKFDTGEYSVTIAGIRQQDPQAFDLNTVDRGIDDTDPNRLRGMVGTKGRFKINPRWTFGWDILAQTDKNFSRTYVIDGYSQSTHTSQAYLTGIGDRNYFDLRAQYFQVQEDVPDTARSATNDKQPWVLPSLDYAYIAPEPVAGGELSIDVNGRALRRDVLDSARFPVRVDSLGRRANPVVPGIEGDNGRLSAEAEWKRSLITEGGLVVTPLLAFRGDAGYDDASAASLDAINQMAADDRLNVEADVRSSLYRWMATAGLELRWPVLFSSVSATSVIEPMAQIFVRPDEQYARKLGIPNEDAQSFVFDASTLFERDKFSGWDRMEGGTRANLGVRYSGTFANGWTTNAIFGQSYQLAGYNSFNSPDLVNAGAYSGLETDTSDFVGLVGFATPNGIAASASGRFDEETFETRRMELKAGYTSRPFTIQAKYAFIQAQPLYGFSQEDRREVTLSGSARFHDNWRVYGSGTYDLEYETMVKKSYGFAYDDDCFTYAMSFAETYDPRPGVTDRREQSIGFNISFRTLGDFGSSTGLNNN